MIMQCDVCRKKSYNLQILQCLRHKACEPCADEVGSTANLSTGARCPVCRKPGTAGETTAKQLNRDVIEVDCSKFQRTPKQNQRHKPRSDQDDDLSGMNDELERLLQPEKYMHNRSRMNRNKEIRQRNSKFYPYKPATKLASKTGEQWLLKGTKSDKKVHGSTRVNAVFQIPVFGDAHYSVDKVQGDVDDDDDEDEWEFLPVREESKAHKWKKGRQQEGKTDRFANSLQEMLQSVKTADEWLFLDLPSEESSSPRGEKHTANNSNLKTDQLKPVVTYGNSTGRHMCSDIVNCNDTIASVAEKHSAMVSNKAEVGETVQHKTETVESIPHKTEKCESVPLANTVAVASEKDGMLDLANKDLPQSSRSTSNQTPRKSVMSDVAEYGSEEDKNSTTFSSASEKEWAFKRDSDSCQEQAITEVVSTYMPDGVDKRPPHEIQSNPALPDGPSEYLGLVEEKKDMGLENDEKEQERNTSPCKATRPGNYTYNWVVNETKSHCCESSSSDEIGEIEGPARDFDSDSASSFELQALKSKSTVKDDDDDLFWGI